MISFLNHLGEFDGKKLVSADRADLKLPETTTDTKKPATRKKMPLLPIRRVHSVPG